MRKVIGILGFFMLGACATTGSGMRVDFDKPVETVMLYIDYEDGDAEACLYRYDSRADEYFSVGCVAAEEIARVLAPKVDA